MSNPTLVPLGGAARAVDAYHSAGGVVDYVLIDVGVVEPVEVHRAAAIAGMKELARQWEAHYDRVALERNRPRDQFEAMRIHPERAVGSPIPLRAFLGRAYDWDAGRIVSLWKRGSGGGASKDGADEFITGGYAEAFSDPPYGMQMAWIDINALFEQINRELLGGLRESLEVWQWSTDWSSYFDSGLEWWGAFLWTVAPPDRPWVAVIAASTSD